MKPMAYVSHFTKTTTKQGTKPWLISSSFDLRLVNNFNDFDSLLLRIDLAVPFAMLQIRRILRDIPDADGTTSLASAKAQQIPQPRIFS